MYNELIKKDYIIYLYEREITEIFETKFDDEGFQPSWLEKVPYYKEVKSVEIGASNSNSPIKAFQPKIVRELSGKNTLTFTLYRKYLDYKTGEYLENPIIDLIHNDSLIKLKLENKYYDLIITKIDIKSDNNTYEYTAEDQYIIELGKNGFSDEFSIELENNIGTIQELGEAILETSDWRVAPRALPNEEIESNIPISDLIYQIKEEPIYQCVLNSDYGLPIVQKTDYIPNILYTDNVYSEIPGNGTFYLFYSQIKNKDTKLLLLYPGIEPITSADNLIVNSYNYEITNVEYNDNGFPTFCEQGARAPFLVGMRGARVVESATTYYSEYLKRPVKKYQKISEPEDEKEYFGYEETNYLTTVLAQNYLPQACNLTGSGSNSGWKPYAMDFKNNEVIDGKIEVKTELGIDSAPFVTNFTLEAGMLNEGLQGYRSNIKTFDKDEEYIVAFLYETEGYDRDINKGLNYYNGLKFNVGFYEYYLTEQQEQKVIPYQKSDKSNEGFIFSPMNSSSIDFISFANENTYEVPDLIDPNKKKKYVYMTIKSNVKISDLTENQMMKLGFFFNASNPKQFYDIQFFKKLKDNSNSDAIVYPGYIDVNSDELLKQKYWYIYEGKPSEMSTLVYFDIEEQAKLQYREVIDENCEKKGSIQGKEQNYFNLIQNLTKTFECWADYVILRDENGEIEYEAEYYEKNTGKVLTEWKEGMNFFVPGYYYKIMGEDLEVYLFENKYNWQQLTLGTDYFYDSEKEQFYYINEYDIKITLPIKVVSEMDFCVLDGIVNHQDYSVNSKIYSLNELKDYVPNYYYVIKKLDETIYKDSLYTINEVISLDTIENPIMCAIMRPKKYVVFKNYINSEPNFAGFKYGVNLKSIQRTEDATQFTTKVIVKDSPNEFADGGLLSIAKASENPIRDTFILNFEYYIRKGIIDPILWYEDLYKPKDGFYVILNKCNTRNEEITEQGIALNQEINRLEADYSTYYLAAQSAQTKLSEYREIFEKNNLNIDFTQSDGSLTDTTKWHFDGFADYNANNGANIIINSLSDVQPLPDTDELTDQHIYKAMNTEKTDWEGKAIVQGNLYVCFGNKQNSLLYHYPSKYDYSGNSLVFNACEKSEEQIKNIRIYTPLYQQLEAAFKGKTELLNNLMAESVELINEKKAAQKRFYKKYSSFIRESNWTSQDYIDDNLYYLDADAALRESAFPKISYNISVIDISKFYDYDCFNFDNGDYTYVEDEEFFGADPITKIPYKEWVVVTQVSEDLDQPENNSITVQNYKSELEDLFSRLTASTQTLDLNKANYARAANLFNPDGTISEQILQKSLDNVTLKFENDLSNSVVWDGEGLRVTNPRNHNEEVKIVGNGVYFTINGGTDWSNPITSGGIDGNVIRIENLDTSKVTISNSGQRAFLWDSHGINAFENSSVPSNTEGEYKVVVNENTFTRMDQFGFYGIKNYKGKKIEEQGSVYWTAEEFLPTAVSDILENDNTIFYLGWDGFRFNSTQEYGVKTIIDDAGIKILKSGVEGNPDTPIFEINEDGNLIVKGDITGSNGTFSGTLKTQSISLSDKDMPTSAIPYLEHGEQKIIVVGKGSADSYYNSLYGDNIIDIKYSEIWIGDDTFFPKIGTIRVPFIKREDGEDPTFFVADKTTVGYNVTFSCQRTNIFVDGASLKSAEFIYLDPITGDKRDDMGNQVNYVEFTYNSDTDTGLCIEIYGKRYETENGEME